MPLLETRGSSSALTYGLNSFSKKVEVYVWGINGGLATSANGLPMTINTLEDTWTTLQNLPGYLDGIPTITNVNGTSNGFSFRVTDTTRVFLARGTSWNAVDLTGWTLLESNIPSLATSDTVLFNVYYRDFTAGIYTGYNTNSALYFFGSKSKTPLYQPSSQYGLVSWHDTALENYNPTSSTWTDVLGNTNATFTNVTINASGRAVFGGPGSASQGTVPYSAAMNPTSEQTIEMWIKPTGNNNGWVRIFGKDPYNPGPMLFFETGGTESTYRTIRTLHSTANGEQRCNSSKQLPLNQWSHVVATFKAGTGMNIYVDGDLVQNAPLTGASLTTNTNPYIIGNLGGETFAGEIGAIRTYNIVMNPLQVIKAYSSQAASYGRTALTSPTVTTYSYTGVDQSITIPAGKTSLKYYLWGAGGTTGGYSSGSTGGQPGGGGGFVSGSLSVTPGQTYTLKVGQSLQGTQQGAGITSNPQIAVSPPWVATYSYGGGGYGGVGDGAGSNGTYGGAGGGGTTIALSGTILAAAGGGGGPGGAGYSGATATTPAAGGAGGTGNGAGGALRGTTTTSTNGTTGITYGGGGGGGGSGSSVGNGSGDAGAGGANLTSTGATSIAGSGATPGGINAPYYPGSGIAYGNSGGNATGGVAMGGGNGYAALLIA